MSLLPIFIKMAGRTALVVGGSALASAKVEALLAAGAEVTVVAPKAKESISDRQQRGEVRWVRRAFESSDVRGKAIVFAATAKCAVDRQVFEICRDAGVWCNAVDDPEYCDFYTPAVVRRGDLQIAISTNGQSPALAQQMRQELESRFDERWSTGVVELGRARREVLATMPPGPERTALLHAQARAAIEAQNAGLFRRVRSAVSRWLNAPEERVPLI